jgi:hypothetical protein
LKVKKNISIEDTLRDKAIKKAKQINMNFSVYVTYLITKDLGEIAMTEELPYKNSKVSSAIDDIIG